MRIVRRFLLPLILLTCTPVHAIEWTEQQIEVLIKVSNYLNNIETLQARFTQVASDGSFAEGTVSIERPGHARFDYDHADVSIIANGVWLAIWDRELEYVDRIPLWDTPLSVLLEEKSDLSKEHEKLGIETIVKEQGVIRLKIFDKDAPENGTLTLMFEEAPMILRRWDAEDATGQVTSVSIYNVEIGLELDRNVFDIPNI